MDKMPYDFICFTSLAFEFGADNTKEIENKIRRQLRYYKAGQYDQLRIEYIRRLKNELQLEISNCISSPYFKKNPSAFSEFEDFDLDKMVIDYSVKYPDIQEELLVCMINFAVYLYHLR